MAVEEPASGAEDVAAEEPETVGAEVSAGAVVSPGVVVGAAVVVDGVEVVNMVAFGWGQTT